MDTHGNITDLSVRITDYIDSQLDELAKKEQPSLPGVEHTLTEAYVKEIEGTYNVSRSKADIDNTIDLLYIAYNATPQEAGDIRASINKLMTSLLNAQGDSENAMTMAVTESDRVIEILSSSFKRWQEVNASADKQELKTFIDDELVDLAEYIKKRAERVSESLEKIDSAYCIAIANADTSANLSEKSLGEGKDDKDKIKDEILKSKQNSARVERLIVDMQFEIGKYAKLAQEFSDSAAKEEDRAKTVSFLKKFFTVLLTVATGFILGPVIAAGGLITATILSNRSSGGQQGASHQPGSSTARQIKIQQAIAAIDSADTYLSGKQNNCASTNEKLKGDKKAFEMDKDPEHADTIAVQVREIAEQIATNNTSITAITTERNLKRAEKDKLNTELNGLKASSSAAPDQTSAGLRDMEKNMLAYMQEYEEAKYEQDFELSKITILLSGQQSSKKDIEITIKSLILSITALKRMREIIFEINCFFSSFAFYMEIVQQKAKDQIDQIEKIEKISKKSGTRGQNALDKLKIKINSVFISQTGRWFAVNRVSSKFKENFQYGSHKLKGLYGEYLTGDKLTQYLKGAIGRIEDIVAQRKIATEKNTLALEEYYRSIEKTVPPTIVFVNQPRTNDKVQTASKFIEYVTWTSQVWFAEVTENGNAFFHWQKGKKQQGHPDTIIEYITGDGKNWQATIKDYVFFHSPQNNPSQVHSDTMIVYQSSGKNIYIEGRFAALEGYYSRFEKTVSQTIVFVSQLQADINVKTVSKCFEYASWSSGVWFAEVTKNGNEFFHWKKGKKQQGHPDTIIEYITANGAKYRATIKNYVFSHAPQSNLARTHLDSGIIYLGADKKIYEGTFATWYNE